mmetsp:Transcript_77613/g.251292  ORF Transcript_77613/g.251292 Transcript_77613/m.251292 type:complete len:375 (+) Transcript_77613:811-1935(+)
MVTRKFSIRCRSPGCALYTASTRDLLISATILAKAITDMSASLVCLSGVVPVSRHTSINASPKFLLGAPCQSSVQPCTISLTWLTNSMVLSLSASMLSVKFRNAAKPKAQSTSVPSAFSRMPAPGEVPAKRPTISAPASPKPRAKRPPSLIMVFSSNTVSIGSLTTFMYWYWKSNRLSLDIFASASFFLACSTSSRRYSKSPRRMASKGLSLIVSIFAIILSMGCSNNSLASLEKDMAPTPTARQMKIVCKMFKPASSFVVPRVSKMKRMLKSFPSTSDRPMAVANSLSEQRNSSVVEQSFAANAWTAGCTGMPTCPEQRSFHSFCVRSMTTSLIGTTLSSQSPDPVKRLVHIDVGYTYLPRFFSWFNCMNLPK